MQQGAYKAYKAYTHCTNESSASTPNTCAPQQAGSLPAHALPMSCYMQSGIRVECNNHDVRIFEGERRILLEPVLEGAFRTWGYKRY